MRRALTVLVAGLCLLLVAGLAGPAAAKPGKGKKKLKPPGSPKIGLVTSSTVQLKWKDRSKEKKFELKVKPGGIKVKAARDATDATIAGLSPNKKYKLKVRACKGKKCSKFTKAKKARTHKVPGNAPPFGFNEAFVPGAAGNNLLPGSGSRFVRVPIFWAQAQPQPLTYDFRRMDRINAELARLGLKPLWAITGSPCWARLDLQCQGGSVDKAPHPAFYGSYADFVARVAKRYPGAIGVQVWNEPNVPKFWAPKPSTSEYRKLLVRTAAAVQSSGSKVPVVYGAPSPVDAADAAKDPKKIPMTTFLRETLRGGVPGLDATALHPYAFNEKGNQIKNGLKLYDQGAAVLKSVARGLPVWVTEIGFTTAGKYRLDPAEQAAALSATYESLVKRGAKLIGIHRLFDQPDSPLAFEAGMGVVQSNRSTVKPAYCSLAVLRGGKPAPCR